MKSRVETLLLDAGGVLVLPNWERVSDTLARHGSAVEADALRRAEPVIKFAIDNALRVRSSTDAGRWGDYLEGVLTQAGVPLAGAAQEALAELRAYHAAHNLWEVVPDDVWPALERLKQSGVRMAIASNANGALHRAFDRLGLTLYFHTICDSCLEGVEKPDPRFFRIVLDRCGGNLASSLHVGDLYHVDVVGARNTGLQALLLDRHDQYAGFDVARVRTLEELAEWLDSEEA